MALPKKQPIAAIAEKNKRLLNSAASREAATSHGFTTNCAGSHKVSMYLAMNAICESRHIVMPSCELRALKQAGRQAGITRKQGWGSQHRAGQPFIVAAGSLHGPRRRGSSTAWQQDENGPILGQVQASRVGGLPHVRMVWNPCLVCPKMEMTGNVLQWYMHWS